MMLIKLTILLLSCCKIQAYLPVVTIPGLMDLPGHLLVLCNNIKTLHPGQECTAIEAHFDATSTLPMWNLTEEYRQLINPYFEKYAATGMHLIGYSQGALIGRALIETTDNHPIKTFVTFAGPNQGQYGISNVQDDSLLLSGLNAAGLPVFTNGLGQNLISIAGYWKDPNDIPNYLAGNKFLAYINNEVNHKDSLRYKTNFERLEKFVCLGGPNDGKIKPWQSTLLGYYNDSTNVVPMEETEVFKENMYGLKTLADRDALFLYEVDADHISIVDDKKYVTDNVIEHLK